MGRKMDPKKIEGKRHEFPRSMGESLMSLPNITPINVHSGVYRVYRIPPFSDTPLGSDPRRLSPSKTGEEFISLEMVVRMIFVKNESR